MLDPPDDVLEKALHQFARERLTAEERIARLLKEFDLVIGYVSLARATLLRSLLSARQKIHP